jgi:putative membrane protein
MKTRSSLWTIAATAALVGAALSGPAAAADTSNSSGSLSKADRDFMMNAAHGGLAEVQTGNIAAQQAEDAKVKSFGERMVKDHSQANDKLMALAQSKGVQLPTTPSGKDERTMKHLQSLSGTDFDKAYSDDMVKDHKADIREFQRAAQNATDPDVKAFAKETLPTLRHHLAMAEALPSERSASAPTQTGTPR